MRLRSMLVTLVLSIACTPALADWPQWRGPAGNGTAPDADPVTTFDPATGENVRWSTPMPGPSSGTPAVVGDRVFVPSFNKANGRLEAIGLDRATGEILWRRDIAQGKDSRERSRENYLAECSPIADAERAYFYFGTGDLVCFDHDGEKLWDLNLSELVGDIRILWGYSSSPLLLDGKLYVQVLRRKPASMLICINAADGEVLWQAERRNDARAESREAYTTPIAAQIDGQAQIVVYGGDALTGHDPATGEELWHFNQELNPSNAGNFRVIGGPSQGPDGMIYVASPRGDVMLAVQVSDSKPELKWMVDRANSDVPCPAVSGDAVFMFAGQRKQLTKLDAESGEAIWSGRIDTPGYFRCSPLVAGGKVYLINVEGELYVYSAGDRFEQLAHVSLGEGSYPSRASIAAAGDALFIRTADKLICAAP